MRTPKAARALHGGRGDAAPPARREPAGVRWVRRCEQGFDVAFGVAANPLRQLGALAFWLLWIVVASGFWTYALYETSITGAWQSVQDMTERQPLTSGVMRSLHRYASDAFMVVMALHLVREWLLGRFRGWRWYTWVSGVPLLWLAGVSGLIGYWMVWDERAQYVGVALFEWLSVWPGIPSELIRNFTDPLSLTDRFFSLLSFLHIGAPLLLLLGSWAHLLRLGSPRTQPRRALAAGSLAMLLLLSLAQPARSMAPVDPQRWPMQVDIDWPLLGLLPLADRLPWTAWALCIAATALLSALPWVPRLSGAAPRAALHGALASGAAAHPRSRRFARLRRRLMKNPVVRLTGQGLMYLAFAAFIGVFAWWPPVQLLPPGHGLLRLSFSAPGKISADCRQRTPEELARLPPQMRAAQECQRARSAVHSRIEVDGQVVVDRDFAPAGLSRDGASSGYWRAPIAAGEHHLKVQFRDDQRPGAPVYQSERTVTVVQGAIVLVDFKSPEVLIR